MLSSYVELTDNIQLACIPDTVSSTYPGVNLNSIAVGWGKTSTNGQLSSLLKNAAIQILNGTTNCNLYGPYNTASQICAG